MLTTFRRDRRNRRQANFDLESLDDRLVLSTVAPGGMAEAVGAKAAIIEHRHEVRVARHEAKLARMEARHEAKLARMEARHEAKLARAAMPATSMTPIVIGGPAAATASAPAATAASSTSGGSTTTAAAPPAVVTTGSGSTYPTAGGTDTGSGSNTGSTGPLPANVAAPLQTLYQEYESQGSSFSPTASDDKLLQISGNSVEVSLKIASGTDFSTALSQLQSDGMQVSSSSASYDLVEGMLPIAELPAAAQIASSVTPVSPPASGPPVQA